MTDYYATADLQVELGEDNFLRLFDRDGDGTADTAVLDRCRTHAQGLVDSILRASHNTPFTGDIDPYIASIAIDLAIARAGESFPGATTDQRTPYSAKEAKAIERLKMLAKDNTARIASGPGEPTASLASTPMQAGVTVGEEGLFFQPSNSCRRSGF